MYNLSGHISLQVTERSGRIKIKIKIDTTAGGGKRLYT